MTYQPRPQASGDTLVKSRDQIRTNFELIQTQFEKNHVSIASDGKHKFMQMPEQLAAPTTAANEGALYTKEASGITSLFFRQESDGTEIQLTGTNITPNILSGTFLSAAGFTDIVLLPANIYGFGIFWKDTSTERGMMATIFTTATTAHGFAQEYVTNGQSLVNPLVLNNASSDLNLEGKYSSAVGATTYKYRIHYWNI